MLREDPRRAEMDKAHCGVKTSTSKPANWAYALLWLPKVSRPGPSLVEIALGGINIMTPHSTNVLHKRLMSREGSHDWKNLEKNH